MSTPVAHRTARSRSNESRSHRQAQNDSAAPHRDPTASRSFARAGSSRRANRWDRNRPSLRRPRNSHAERDCASASGAASATQPASLRDRRNLREIRGSVRSGAATERPEERLARDANMREKLIEIGTGEVDVDDMRPRREADGGTSSKSIDGSPSKTTYNNCCPTMHAPPSRAPATPPRRVQLGRGHIRAEVGQQAAVARARHFRLHIG